MYDGVTKTTRVADGGNDEDKSEGHSQVQRRHKAATKAKTRVGTGKRGIVGGGRDETIRLAKPDQKRAIEVAVVGNLRAEHEK